MTVQDLISPAYCDEQRWLHRQPRGYGAKGAKWATAVLGLAMEYGGRSVLDYGCGQGSLAVALQAAPGGLLVHEYDPAVPGKDALPAPADLVVCTDVLEHVEPDRLEAVVRHLRALTRRAALIVIATRPASKLLSTGSNAHLTIQPASWWGPRLEAAGFLVLPGPASPLPKPSRECVTVCLPREGAC